MRKWMLILFFPAFFLSHQVEASHIVGGEFELLHDLDFQYRINLNLYFDVAHGHPGAFDQNVLVAIYRKSDHTLMQSLILNYQSRTRVEYFQHECSNGEVVTDKIIYTAVVTLPEIDYSDPEGYYIAWERCCRNYDIENIYSSDPETGIYAGQTFYLEFPPVVLNNERFINSSPVLFPPLNDYGCPGRFYWVDFKGVDSDGDSLVYSLTKPFNTTTSASVVVNGANRGPYPTVSWRPGYSLKNIMNGKPDLEVSEDGFLTVTPTKPGLYVFAVKVEEFRNGRKIGEIRRDFQMFVQDKCAEATAPIIKGKKITDNGFIYREEMTVSFPGDISDEERCIEVQVADPDALKLSQNFSERVFIRAIPLDFKDDVSGILPEDFDATLLNGSTANFKICFSECPYLPEGNFKIGIVAFDDACALPLTDTLRIQVYIEPPFNTKAYFLNEKNLNFTVQEQANGLLVHDILARDDDLDSLSLHIQPLEEFDPASFGITYNEKVNDPGKITTAINWNYDCQKVSFDGRTHFPFLLTVDDKDKCNIQDPSFLNLNLTIQLPPNSEPDVKLENIPGFYHFVEARLKDTINFDVWGNDVDNDPITLTGEGINFNLEELDILFPQKEGDGVPGIEAPFQWGTLCSYNLAEQDSFRMHFYVEDQDKCQITNKDTLIIDIKLLPPASNAPLLNVSGNPDFFDGDTVEVIHGSPISLHLLGNDIDADTLSLSMINLANFPQANFTQARNYKKVNSTFEWTPECDILNKRESVGLTGTFLIVDNNCYVSKSDTVSVQFIIHDNENFEERFRAPNIITPNDDSYNDYFTLNNIYDAATGQNVSMPEDNCAGQFRRMQIFNRWGRQIFTSTDRDFKWAPADIPTGTFYYYVEFTDKIYKGFIAVIY